MLWPSTRATWNPKVTMRVAYTAAGASVFSHATSSSTTRAMLNADGRSTVSADSGGAPVSPPARAGTGSAGTSGSTGAKTVSGAVETEKGGGSGGAYASGGVTSGGGAYGS